MLIEDYSVYVHAYFRLLTVTLGVHSTEHIHCSAVEDNERSAGMQLCAHHAHVTNTYPYPLLWAIHSCSVLQAVGLS